MFCYTAYMKSDYVTKQDLKEALTEFRKELLRDLLPAIDIRMDIKLEAMERRIDDRARQYNSEILTKFDSWAGELESAQIDRTISTSRFAKLSDKVKDHEKRIKKLEKN